MDVHVTLLELTNSIIQSLIEQLNRATADLREARKNNDRVMIDRAESEIKEFRQEMRLAKDELHDAMREVQPQRQLAEASQEHHEEKVGSVASHQGQMVNPSSETTFVGQLLKCAINKPDADVISIITRRFPQQFQSALSSGIPQACLDLYNVAKSLPTSFTRGVIQQQLHISINGPMSLAQPNILAGVDLRAQKHILVKLLQIPITSFSSQFSERKEAVLVETEACRSIFNAGIDGLVSCEIIEVKVVHTQQLDVHVGNWAAIKMSRYVTSLAELPQLSEGLLLNGFRRIHQALIDMHKLDLVHMDVKSDNVFVNEHLRWDLGDFGSARQPGQLVWSFTEVLNPFRIPRNATVHPSFDYVQLCIMIAVELHKATWKVDLCGSEPYVQEGLVRARFDQIENSIFRNELIDLFEANIGIAKEHVFSFTASEC